MLNSPCPCGAARTYAKCCNRYISGDKLPPIAEALMRSRYTAYCVGDIDYVLATWAPQTVTQVDAQSLAKRKAETEYLGLKIISKSAGTRKHNQGQVEFEAKFITLGKQQTHHENSNFIKIDGKWHYVDGQVNMI